MKKQHVYSLFDYTVTSNIPLQLPNNHIPSHNLVFSFSKQNCKAQHVPKSWIHHWKTDEDKTLFSYTEFNGEYFLKFPSLAIFSIHLASRSIKCYPESKISESFISHLFVDQIFPRIVNHLFSLTLHCCANRIENSALLFLGQTGWGKSTLGANFHVNGFEILNDDAITVRLVSNNCVAIPNYCGIRLKEDSIKEIFEPHFSASNLSSTTVEVGSKKQLSIAQTHLRNALAPLPIRAIFVLNEPETCQNDTPYITKQTLPQATISLINFGFYLNIKSCSEMSRCLSETTLLAAKVPTYLLNYRRKYCLLNSVREVILELITQSESEEGL